MKKIALTDSEKKLLLIAAAIGILALAYFMFFTKNMDKAQALETKNAADRATVEQLESMVARQPATIAETEQFKKDIEKIVEKYPSQIPQEKLIYIVQQMEENVGVDYSSISFALENTLMNFSGAEKNPVGGFASISLPYSASYSELKTLFDYVKELEDRTTMPVLTVSFDQTTGELNGAVTYRMFYLKNTGKPYEEIPATGIESGLGDIFQTGEE